MERAAEPRLILVVCVNINVLVVLKAREVVELGARPHDALFNLHDMPIATAHLLRLLKVLLLATTA